MVEPAHLARLGVHRPDPPAAIGEAVATAQLAEGVAGKRRPDITTGPDMSCGPAALSSFALGW